MMMIVDMSQSSRSFGDCQKDLDAVGEQIGVSIKCQKEEILKKCTESRKMCRKIDRWT